MIEINQTERFLHDFKKRKFFALGSCYFLFNFGTLLINTTKYFGLDFEHERPRLDVRCVNPISSVIDVMQVFLN